MKKVILFGASKLGEIAYNLIKDKYEICFFSDNDSKKWRKEFCDKKIIPPKELIKYEDYIVIIASMYSLEITLQLQKMGIKHIKTFSYNEVSKSEYFISDTISVEEILNIDLNLISNKLENNAIRDEIHKNSSENEKKRKRVLIIAYIFPPIGGSGVQRTLKFVKNLIKCDWVPIVITVGKNICSEKEDVSLLNEISKEVRIIRIDENIMNIENLSIDEIKSIFKLYMQITNKQVTESFIEEYKKKQGKDLLMPDKHIVWVNNVLEEIEKIIDLEEIDVLFSTSAPYSDHILAYNIKNKYGMPWVADFRDEWTNNHIINYDKTKKYYMLQYLMEKNIVKTADNIITVSEISTENYINNFELENSKVYTITNGYDEDDFNEIDLKITNPNKKFTIIFNGTLYKEAPPYNLIISIENLITNNIILSSKIQIIFIGTINENIKKNIEKMKLKFDILWYGYMPHKESLKIAAQGDLLFTNAGSTEKCKASYTGKIFEYLRLCKPILVFSPNGSVLDKLLSNLNRGKSIEENDILSIENAVSYYYDNWIKGKNNNLSKNDILPFERRNLTKKLVEIFNRLID